MRPLPWSIRVSLFATGFGVGLLQYKPAAPTRPVILEIHLAVPDSDDAVRPAAAFSNLPCAESSGTGSSHPTATRL